MLNFYVWPRICAGVRACGVRTGGGKWLTFPGGTKETANAAFVNKTLHALLNTAVAAAEKRFSKKR